MIWICVIIFSLFIGIGIGAITMYYKNRNILQNQKNLYNELKNNKIKLNEYQKRLNTHFTYNIELLNRIAENYQNLYQNMTKNANFFLPNSHTKDNIYALHTENNHNKNNKHSPIKIPRDYSENIEIFQKEKNDLK